MCYFIERTQKCTKLFFNHYLPVKIPKNSCRYENKTVTLRHGFLIQMIMKQVEERYISSETSKMAYRDIKNSVDTAKREGLAEGIEIGMEKGMNQRSLEIAKKMLTKGMDEASVMDMTGLTAEEIKLLKAEM